MAQLLEDSEMKTEALERAEDIEDELSRVCLLELFLNTYSKLECLVIIEIWKRVIYVKSQNFTVLRNLKTGNLWEMTNFTVLS